MAPALSPMATDPAQAWSLTVTTGGHGKQQHNQDKKSVQYVRHIRHLV